MLETSPKPRINEQREAERQRFIEVYKLVANGELSTDDACSLLGYANYKNMDRRRWGLGLPPLRDIGLGLVRSIREVSDEEITAAMERIAEARYNGQDIKQEEAKRMGFTCFKQLDDRRTRLGMPSVRDLMYYHHPELFEKYTERVNRQCYIKKLARNREKNAKKRNCEG